jgi:hypothetical protein
LTVPQKAQDSSVLHCALRKREVKVTSGVQQISVSYKDNVACRTVAG